MHPHSQPRAQSDRRKALFDHGNSAISSMNVHIFRQWRFKLHDAFPVPGCSKANAPGVQSLAPKCANDFACGRIDACHRAAVQWIAFQRRADGLHVHTNLVCAAGFEFAFHQRVVVEAINHPVVRDSQFAAHVVAALAPPFWCVGCGCRSMGASTVPSCATNPRTNATRTPATWFALAIVHQCHLRGLGFGHHHDTAGVLVQPVHDARTRNACRACVMKQHAVEQRAVPIAGRRVHQFTSPEVC